MPRPLWPVRAVAACAAGLLTSATLAVAVAPAPAAPAIERAKRPTLTFTPEAPLQGTTVKVRTKLPTAFKRPTVLQQKATGTPWRTIARKKSKASGKVVFKLPAPGLVKLRIVAKKVTRGGRVTPAVTTKSKRLRTVLRNSLVSTSITGVSPAVESGGSSLSADGRYLVFISSGANLVTGFTGYVDGNSQVYLRDRVAGTTVLVSQGTTPGVVGNNTSTRAAISRNGQYVAFASYASNLEPGDTNGLQDIFRWNRLTNSITQISKAGNGSGTDAHSFDPTISGNGERIAYSTEATNIDTDDDNGVSDMYVWDAQDGEGDRVSEDIADGDGNGASNAGTISADGEYLVFSSTASDLVFNDDNGVRDTFRRNIDATSTALVSKATAGAANAYSSNGVPSADGRYVAFSSAADNLVAGGSPDNGKTHVFVRDMIAGTTVWVSRDSSGGATNDFAFSPGSVSDDGRYITFTSSASDLVAGDTNGVPDAFLWDRSTAQSRLVVRDSAGGWVNGAVYEPVLSADGRWVVFYSTASDLVPQDTNPIADAYVHRLR